jgi:serine/threonine protein phosphatase PrpC
VLAISRAFGDASFKDLSYNNSRSPVVATPELTSELVTPMTEFCVIASDGLWDVVDAQWVVNFVRKKIKLKISIEDICRGLADEAIEKGSIDNVSAVIIMFHMNKDEK